MEKKYVSRANEVGVAYAEKLYADWKEHPEEDIGPKFKWSRFHKLCGRIASVSLFTCFTDDEWHSLQPDIDSLKNMCREAAEKRATELLQENSGNEDNRN